jgi:hypothetical protein
MSDWLFGALWVACAGVGLTVGARRFRRYGATHSSYGRVQPEVAATVSRVELAMWGLFCLCGLVYLVVALAD